MNILNFTCWNCESKVEIKNIDSGWFKYEIKCPVCNEDVKPESVSVQFKVDDE